MRKTRCGEDRQLLTTDQRVQTVDRGDTGLDELSRERTGCRVHRSTVDVKAFVRNDLGTAVDGTTQTVEDSAKHVLRHAQFHLTSGKADLGLFQVDTGGAFEQLDDSVGAVDFQNTAAAGLAVGQFDLTEFVVGDVLDVTDDHKRTGYFLYSSILFWHYGPASP